VREVRGRTFEPSWMLYVMRAICGRCVCFFISNKAMVQR